MPTPPRRCQRQSHGLSSSSNHPVHRSDSKSRPGRPHLHLCAFMLQPSAGGSVSMKAQAPPLLQGGSAVTCPCRSHQALSPGHQNLTSPRSTLPLLVFPGEPPVCSEARSTFPLPVGKELRFLGKCGHWCCPSACSLDPGPSHPPELHVCPAAPALGCHSAASYTWTTFPTLIFVVCRLTHLKEIDSETCSVQNALLPALLPT